MNEEIRIVEGDVLTTSDPVVVHCCNTRNTMNSGVARALRQRFPEIYLVDSNLFEANPDGLLGHCELVPITTDLDKTAIKYIANLYGQKNYGYEGARYLDYEAFYTSLHTLRMKMESLKLKRVSMPYKIGCGLAGGHWPVVEAMIKHIFCCCLAIEVTLYKL